jgi:rhodanese-related sulfurtransferase
MFGSMTFRFFLWLVGLGAWVAPASSTNPLRLVEKDLAQRYDGIQQCDPGALAKRLLQTEPSVTLLDARSAEEFEISHIPGAIRVDPNISPAEFGRDFGDLAKGRDVVVYCSVGARSTALAHRLQRSARAVGAKSVCNLSGGLFRWHNEGRPLVRHDEPAESVHPFNDYWARFIKPAPSP